MNPITYIKVNNIFTTTRQSKLRLRDAELELERSRTSLLHVLRDNRIAREKLTEALEKLA